MSGYCECIAAGFCKKHACDKSQRDFEICSGINISESAAQSYRTAWEEGTSWAQLVTVSSKAKVSRTAFNGTTALATPQPRPQSVIHTVTPEDVPCEYRGAFMREDRCTTCAGKGNPVDVYECSAPHNAAKKCCTMSHRINGMPSCQRCEIGEDDFQDAYEAKMMAMRKQRQADAAKKQEAAAQKAAERQKAIQVERIRSRPYNPKDELRNKPEPFPFTGTPRLTLLFHCYPKHGWAKHIEWMRKHATGYDRKIMCIAVDSETATAKQVKEAFGDGWEYLTVKNDPKLREVVSYRKMFPLVMSSDPNEIIVCAHGKGAQPHTEASEAIHRWTDMMYETVVGNLDGIVKAMSDGYTVAGSFRRFGNHFGSRYKYHYSGTFYALRAAKLPSASRKGPKIRSNFWGTESLPGDLIPVHQSYCFLHDNAGDMYKSDNHKPEEFEQWKVARMTTGATT